LDDASIVDRKAETELLASECTHVFIMLAASQTIPQLTRDTSRVMTKAERQENEDQVAAFDCHY